MRARIEQFPNLSNFQSSQPWGVDRPRIVLVLSHKPVKNSQHCDPRMGEPGNVVYSDDIPCGSDRVLRDARKKRRACKGMCLRHVRWTFPKNTHQR